MQLLIETPPELENEIRKRLADLPVSTRISTPSGRNKPLTPEELEAGFQRRKAHLESGKPLGFFNIKEMERIDRENWLADPEHYSPIFPQTRNEPLPD